MSVHLNRKKSGKFHSDIKRVIKKLTDFKENHRNLCNVIYLESGALRDGRLEVLFSRRKLCLFGIDLVRQFVAPEYDIYYKSYLVNITEIAHDQCHFVPGLQRCTIFGQSGELLAVGASSRIGMQLLDFGLLLHRLLLQLKGNQFQLAVPRGKVFIKLRPKHFLGR